MMARQLAWGNYNIVWLQVSTYRARHRQLPAGWNWKGKVALLTDRRLVEKLK